MTETRRVLACCCVWPGAKEHVEMRKMFDKMSRRSFVYRVVGVFAAGCVLLAGITVGSGAAGALPAQQVPEERIDGRAWPELPVRRAWAPAFPLRETDVLGMYLFHEDDLVKAEIYFLKACNAIGWSANVGSTDPDSVSSIDLLAISTMMHCGDSPAFSLEKTEISLGELPVGRYSMSVSGETVQFRIG